MTAEEKMDLLKSEHEDTLLIGRTNEEAMRYLDALVGIDNFDRAVYEYERLVECFMETYNISDEDAREWIDYNVIRSLPYMGERAPVIICTSFEWIEC